MQRNEEREQARLIKWTHKVAVRAVLPQLRWLHHSPNGGKRDAITGGQMKALGTKPGFPDLILPVRSGEQIGLVIEMKSATGSTTTEQKEWLANFAAQGWSTAVCRSAADAREALLDYFGVSHDGAPPLEA